MRVERTDFISLPTQNMERAKRFYGETLGLPRNERASDKFPEFETGNVTLLLLDPDSIGVEFSPNRSGFALRVPDVAAARAELEAQGVEFFRGRRRFRCLPHGVPRRSGRERDRAPQPLRAVCGLSS